jgi:hypothetical protein
MALRVILGGLAKAQAATQPTRWITNREGKRVPIAQPGGTAEPKREQRIAEIKQQVAARQAQGPRATVIAGGRVKPIGATSKRPAEEAAETAEAEKKNWYRSYADTSTDPHIQGAAATLAGELKASKDKNARSALNQGLKALGLLAQEAKNGPIPAERYAAVAARASWIAKNSPDKLYANAMGVVAETFDLAAQKAGKGPVNAQAQPAAKPKSKETYPTEPVKVTENWMEVEQAGPGGKR